MRHESKWQHDWLTRRRETRDTILSSHYHVACILNCGSRLGETTWSYDLQQRSYGKYHIERGQRIPSTAEATLQIYRSSMSVRLIEGHKQSLLRDFKVPIHVDTRVKRAVRPLSPALLVDRQESFKFYFRLMTSGTWLVVLPRGLWLCVEPKR